MQAPGRILLLVTGIIYIVMGVYAVIFGLFTEFIGQVIGGWGHMADVQGVETEMDALGRVSTILNRHPPIRLGNVPKRRAVP